MRQMQHSDLVDQTAMGIPLMPLDLVEMQKWADDQYDVLGGTAYARLNQLLAEVTQLRIDRDRVRAAARRVAAELVVLGTP
jgi:hypothetical protein